MHFLNFNNHIVHFEFKKIFSKILNSQKSEKRYSQKLHTLATHRKNLQASLKLIMKFKENNFK